MKYLILTCILVYQMIFAFGCALGKGVRPVYENKGAQVFEATCNGTGRTMGDCYAQAAKTCDGNFEPVNNDSSSTAMISNGNLIPIQKRNLLFQCSKN